MLMEQNKTPNELGVCEGKGDDDMQVYEGRKKEEMTSCKCVKGLGLIAWMSEINFIGDLITMNGHFWHLQIKVPSKKNVAR